MSRTNPRCYEYADGVGCGTRIQWAHRFGQATRWMFEARDVPRGPGTYAITDGTAYTVDELARLWAHRRDIPFEQAQDQVRDACLFFRRHICTPPTPTTEPQEDSHV
jgi:hypothetical protein